MGADTDYITYTTPDIEGLSLPSGQDMQSRCCVPGALSYGTYEPFGHFLQLSDTYPASSE